MTTSPSAVPTTSNLPADDTPIIHSNMETNRASDIDQHHLLLINEIDGNINDQFYSFPSLTVNMGADQASSHGDQYSAQQKEQPIESQPCIISNQTSVCQPIPSSSNNDANVSYGVDCSDRARPTSHSWFPFTSNDSSSVAQCAYISCTKMKPIHQSTLLECGSCGLIVHSHHLNDLQTGKAECLPSCRPSFIDDTENSLKYDRHFWCHVTVLPKPCVHCQATSMPTNLFSRECSRLSTMSAFDILDQVTSVMNSVSENLNAKISESSNGLLCLWCSKGYHQSCWELVVQDGESQCDYGIFRNIIVRPQWLSRCRESPTGFRARLPSYSADNKSESDAFPYTPLLLFINKRSGGQIGEKIYRELLRKLNPRQIFLIENNATITHALDTYASLPNIRICVFGGDGTVGWILGRLADMYPSRNNPPVGICPLGTGNDLSRVLTWGEQYDPKRLLDTLLQIHQAQAVPLDRWLVQLEQLDRSTSTSPIGQHHESGFKIGRIFQPFPSHPKFIHEANRASYPDHHELPNTRFINYMSFGLDAAIALDFHVQRTRDPSKFSSPLKNKLMYLNESCKYLNDFARANMWDVSSYIRLICDGHDLTDATRECHTLVVLNIPGYASGTNPWGKSSSINSQLQVLQKRSGLGDLFEWFTNTDKTNEPSTFNDYSRDQMAISSTTTVSSDGFERQDFGDRKIEVVGLSTAHMATIHVGFRGKRIAQCHQLRIELCNPMTAQMDGEPFYLPASVAVNIAHAGQVLVLKNDN